MPSEQQPAAVALISGGMDSVVAAAIVRAQGRRIFALTIDYGQRHRAELEAAKRAAKAIGAEQTATVRLDLRALGGSALTADIDVPKDRDEAAIGAGVPVTYVPARNLVFLSLAIGWAEVVGAREVVIGVNAVDYSGYPDCREEFIDAFQRASALGTRAGDSGAAVRVLHPLSGMSKADVVRRGAELGVDFSITHSCYDPDPRGRACGRCDACSLRRRGFEEAGVPDPTVYAHAQSGR